MAFHELGTNSAKYGVLAGVSGKVTVSWSVGRGPTPELKVSWDEAFDEPLVPEPQAGRGFGTVVLERVTPVALNGRANTTRTASRITWTLEAPVSSILVEEGGADSDA
jgi:two-component sensor histidine kinase